MPAQKKAANKTPAKKAVGKKSAASAPKSTTRSIHDGATGEFVSKQFAKTHPDTTMSVTNHPKTGSAAKKSSTSAKKSGHTAKKSSTPAKKVASKSAPAKKHAAPAAKKHVAPAKKAAAPAKKSTAKKSTMSPTATRVAHKALDKVGKVAKQASKALASPNATTRTIESHAAKLGTTVVRAIVDTAHAAESKSHTTAPTRHTSAAVTPRQHARDTGFKAPQPAPGIGGKSKSPFHPEAVTAMVDSTNGSGRKNPLVKSANGVFN